MTDPVVWAQEEHPHWPDLFRQYIFRDIIIVGHNNSFVRSGMVSDNLYVNNLDENWTISKNWSSRIKGENRDKEDVLDYIRDEFPEHFEWLLWHPELL